MCQYKLYPINDAGLVSGPADVIEAAHDTAAVALATAALSEVRRELWLDTRLVGQLSPSPATWHTRVWS